MQRHYFKPCLKLFIIFEIKHETLNLKIVSYQQFIFVLQRNPPEQ